MVLLMKITGSQTSTANILESANPRLGKAQQLSSSS
jgi:hypothetical protein